MKIPPNTLPPPTPPQQSSCPFLFPSTTKLFFSMATGSHQWNSLHKLLDSLNTTVTSTPIQFYFPSLAFGGFINSNNTTTTIVLLSWHQSWFLLRTVPPGSVVKSHMMVAYLDCGHQNCPWLLLGIHKCDHQNCPWILQGVGDQNCPWILQDICGHQNCPWLLQGVCDH